MFLTVDQGIEYQQNLSVRTIAIILLRVKSNRLEDMVPHVGEILSVSASIEPGQLVYIPSMGK